MKRVLRAAAAAWLVWTVGLAAEVPDAKTHPADTYPFARGIIEKFDLVAKEVTLKTERGSREFELTPSTYIFRGKERLTPDKLKLGDSLKLNYYTNEFGRALIRRIKVVQPETAQP